MAQLKCPICNGQEIQSAFDAASKSPLARYGLQDDMKTALTCDTFEVHVQRCCKCNHHFNSTFRPENVDYTSETIAESRVFSPRYLNYLKSQAENLSKFVGKSANCVLEIGSGSGDFLSMFSGMERKIGFEPGPEALLSKQKYPEIETRKTYFSTEPSEHDDLLPDLIIMRQVLEHVQSPMDFLRCFHNLLTKQPNKDGVLYIEVPSTNATIHRARFSDFYYDHVGFFTINSLSEAIRRSGFFIEKIESTFDGEILSCICRPSLKVFSQINFSEKQQYWKKLLQKFQDDGKKVIFWGSAGTGTMFLNLMNAKWDAFPYVVDSDARKHGKFVPGTGQKVVSPSFICEFQPDVVLILSQLHSIEIEETVRSTLNYEVDIYKL